MDLYGNVVYYIYWFDKYGYNITNEWKFWSKGPKKKYDRVNRYLTDSWLKEYCGNNNLKIRRILEIGDTNVFYPHIKENRPWDIEEMDWYDLREHANTMSDFIQKLYNYI